MTTNQDKVLTQLRSTLVHAVTQYDQKQSKRAGYNHYAIGHYLGAVAEICTDLEANPEKLTRDAIVEHFNGRLLDICLRACGFATSTRDEQRGTL